MPSMTIADAREISRITALLGGVSTPLASSLAAVGSVMPIAERKSSELIAWLATALNFWTGKRMPPKKKQQPSTF